MHSRITVTREMAQELEPGAVLESPGTGGRYEVIVARPGDEDVVLLNKRPDLNPHPNMLNVFKMARVHIAECDMQLMPSV